ncbi:sporulation protein [Vibrio mexicanus]|uniref:sporulation protein n=1 Tax=Vibrio mexicanus TaxID=1004326 RepID=UPI00063CDD0C|nr:sporulation protein [Vibrio mexicanus]
MSFFKKTLASFGIGSASVDTVLKQEVVYPGQKVSVTIHVYGGSTAQEVDNINLELCCQYVKEVPASGKENDHSGRTRRVKKKHVLSKWSLPYAFTIEPGDTRDFDVELEVPINTPVTLGDAKVWLDTGLDISMAVDPTDKDILTVRPDALMDGIFTAFEEQGLRIRQVECEAVSGFELPFVQEFEFVPTTGPFHGRWRELEIVAHRDGNDLKLWFEVDRNRTGMKGMLASMLGLGELKRELTLPLSMDPKEAGEKVLTFLDETS